MDSVVYRNLVEDTAQKVDPSDVLIPADTLAHVDSLGFCVDTFQDDVLQETERRKTTDDPRQLTLNNIH